MPTSPIKKSSPFMKLLTDLKRAPMSTLHHWQNQRITWFVMFASTLFLELCALYFQYIMKLDPCERCVYQRLAILVLMVNSVIMWVKPTHWGVRIAGYSLWLVGAVYGLKEAIAQLADYGSFNPFSSSCSLKPTFPFDLPLYDWWPSLFMPTGLCGADNWSFLSLNMGPVDGGDFFCLFAGTGGVHHQLNLRCVF